VQGPRCIRVHASKRACTFVCVHTHNASGAVSQPRALPCNASQACAHALGASGLASRGIGWNAYGELKDRVGCVWRSQGGLHLASCTGLKGMGSPTRVQSSQCLCRHRQGVWEASHACAVSARVGTGSVCVGTGRACGKPLMHAQPALV